MNELRPYQTDIIAEFHRTTAQFQRIILVAPTGSGKTIVAAAIIKDFVRQHIEVLVLAHRREIIGQTSKKLDDRAISHGIIQAGENEKLRPLAPVQVASVQTLWSRAMRTDANGKTRMELPPAKLIVVDECHHATARTWRKILEAYPDAIILGLTATPVRGDGRGLGGIFETIIECPQVAELIEQEYLVRSRVYAPSTPDLTGVRVQAGDYVESQLASRMDRPQLTADIVGSWFKYGERRPTVCFATGVGHSIHLRDEFIKSGVPAEHIDGGTPKDERDATLARLAAGEIDLVTNCMVLTEGWDLPAIGCCILARPTKKMGLFRQMIGRVLRPAPGKTDAIILDHSGAVFKHGLPEDHVDWFLSPDFSAESPDHVARGIPGGAKLLDCSQCGALREGGKACPHCGFLPVRTPQLVVCEEGELALVENRKPGKAELNQHEWHAMLVSIGHEKGYKPGWAAHKFKEKFGYWPPSGSVIPIDPTPEVRSWVRSRAIAWAKTQEKARTG
jgi:superfamily II DNA or RNA helicase